jgi:hypothetical protein
MYRYMNIWMYGWRWGRVDVLMYAAWSCVIYVRLATLLVGLWSALCALPIYSLAYIPMVLILRLILARLFVCAYAVDDFYMQIYYKIYYVCLSICACSWF